MSHFNLVCHMTTTFIVTMLACPGKDKTSTGRTTTNVNLICSRNYRFYRNGNSANLFSYACKGKDFSRFVYLYLKQNSCQCLIFVFYASRYRLWIRCDVCQQNKKPEESYAVSDVKHRHSNSVANLMLITYITMHKQKALVYKLSRSKAPKHSKFRLTDIREKPVAFFYVRPSTLARAIILLTQIPFQSFPLLYNL